MKSVFRQLAGAGDKLYALDDTGQVWRWDGYKWIGLSPERVPVPQWLPASAVETSRYNNL